MIPPPTGRAAHDARYCDAALGYGCSCPAPCEACPLDADERVHGAWLCKGCARKVRLLEREGRS